MTVFDQKKAIDTLLQKVSENAFQAEQKALEVCKGYVNSYKEKSSSIASKAGHLIETIRENEKESGFEAFLHQNGLDSNEGVTILCLAECLLRIPDNKTIDLLIHDKFTSEEWNQHIDQDSSSAKNASAMALKLTGKVVSLQDSASHSPGALLGKMVSKFGEPIIRASLKKAMKILSHQFILGEDMPHALKQSRELSDKGYLFSFDILGESARSRNQAISYFNRYMDAIDDLAKNLEKGSLSGSDINSRPSVSIKLSALHPRVELANHKDLMKQLLPRLKRVVSRCMQHNFAVTIDAEEYKRLDISLMLFEQLIKDPEFEGYNGLGLVIQAYQKCALDIIDVVVALAEKYQKNIPVRLVKGAYWDSEIKAAQVAGIEDYPVYVYKEHTDISYLACASKLLENDKLIYPQFATHNAASVSAIMHIAGNKQYEFQRLFGMGQPLFDQLVENHRCRIYAPVGEYKELLAYLIRRIIENSANSSFLKVLYDQEVPITDLTKDPLLHLEKMQPVPHPDIPLPRDLYVGGRINSQGFELGNRVHLNYLVDGVKEFDVKEWSAAPLISGQEVSGDRKIVYSPVNLERKLGTVIHSCKDHCDKVISSAARNFAKWNDTPPEERAELLEKYADLLEENRLELMAILMHEAGKCYQDGLAEVREAVDFCRYYALQLREKWVKPEELKGPTGERNELSFEGKGVFVCISPWNFPLAIFIGQISAALAAGNSVVAKSAEPTSLIAMKAVQLLFAAGVPHNVVHFLPGSSSKIGNRLVKSTKVAGVAFTGSLAVAKHINQQLAKRDGAIGTMIAETGGQNCMIVDSTALLEQTVDDIISSAFNSAGQRCSALRVLYVQDEIANDLVELLAGAMETLHVGHPQEISTDVPCVINKEAEKNINEHIRKMHKNAKLICGYSVKEPLTSQGHYIAPHAFEIDSLDDLKREVFGPVLHVIRYKSSDLDKVIDAINDSGYGLTLGIQTRINERAEYIAKRVKVGNVYVNRDIVGAVVGIQPFGGIQLSGTGGKVGGPLALHGFANLKSQCQNLAAIGGDLHLLG